MAGEATIVAFPAQEPPLYYTVAQARSWLGVTKSVFYRYVRSGKVRRVTVPGVVGAYYLQSDVDALVEERQRSLPVQQLAERKPVRQRPTLETASAAPLDLPINLLDTYSGHEACTLLGGISRSSLSELARRGRIRQFQILGQRYPGYYKPDVDALVVRKQAKHEDLYTLQEACQRLAISDTSIYRLVREGKIHTALLPDGRHSGYVKTDVDGLVGQYKRQRDRPVSHPDVTVYQCLYERMAMAQVCAESGETLLSRGVRYLVRRCDITVQQAEDIVQEVFTDLWEHAGDFFEHFPYIGRQVLAIQQRLRTAVGNVLSQEGTREVLREQLLRERVSWLNPHVPTVEELVFPRLGIQAVMQYCRRLPVVERVVAEMMIKGYSMLEIAEYLYERRIGSARSVRAVGRVWSGVIEGLREQSQQFLPQVER